ncbi:Hypothetical Protein RSSE_p0330 (plasmid) [Ralstonia solanacearum]|nr:Hypothetical Protein RSSE_p0330 [Ralstonia solanacearum]
MAFSTALQNLLNNYNSQSGGTASTPSTAYTSLINALNASPDLLASYTAAADSGALTAINYTPPSGAPSSGAYFISSGSNAQGIYQGSITITPSFLNSPGQNNINNNIFVLRHEIQHLFDSTSSAQLYNSLNQAVSSYYSDPANNGTPLNVTNNIKSYVTTQLQDEGQANIAGWNAEVSEAVAANGGKPLTMDQLYTLANNDGQGTYASFFFSINVGTRAVTPNSSYTVNMDPASPSYGMVAMSNANIVQAGIDQGPRLQSSSGLTYQLSDTVEALNKFANDSGGQSLSVDYGQFGLTSNGGDLALMQSGFVGGNSGNAVLVNVADNTIHTFLTTTNGGATTIDAKTFSISNNAMLLVSDTSYAVDAGSKTITIGNIINGGSSNIDVKTYTDSTRGILASDVLTSYSADGKTATVRSDTNGDGKVDSVNTTVFTDNSRTAIGAPP